MSAYTAEVLKLINERVDFLNAQLELDANKEHEYALRAGIFELLGLGQKVQSIANREAAEIRARRKRDIEISWERFPDRSGGQYSQDEIDRSRNGGW